MTDSAVDLQRLGETLDLARRAIGVSDPNPRVGCVIAAPDGRILGRGSTQQAGGPHAEVVALAEARASGADLRGGTAWVSLEPCAHHGRTPPCCDALIDAGLARVVVATADPNPLVAGQGIARMRAAGISVDVADPSEAIAQAARELNIGFFSRMKRGRPWVRLKVAASLDGRTALDDGTSQWITGEAARTDGHAFRKRASAVLTGVGTVLEDDPRLDVRLVPTARQPWRVIVDSRLQTPPGSRIVQPPGEVLLFHAAEHAGRAATLAGRGVQLCRLPNAAGKVDLAELLAELARRGVNELHVEAGAKLNASFLREGLVDELLVYQAPKLIGAGRGIAELGPLGSLAEALEFEFTQIDRIGADLRLLARPAGRTTFQDDN